ncbi:MAG: VWA domain-containing protein [Planctomycetes bacterium]|nr:VWA domain-containing protein [Planctomycetota bacterium]
MHIRTLLLASSLLAPAMAAPETAPQRTVDLAICLDTSGSMEGLIHAARTRIWSIVNELALAKPSPRLRVALLAYGTPGYGQENGHVTVLTDFTEDLDAVSGKLFALTTDGGDEYVGRVVRKALTLSWTKGDGLKLAVVAGNESADQDSEAPFRDQCRAAIGAGIMVNAIYCGAPGAPDAEGYKEVARLSDGHYAAIDQNNNVDLASPFDAEIAALNTALNATYLPLASCGAEGTEKQVAADADAEKAGAIAQRAQAKCQSQYWNAWCVVDLIDRGDRKLEDLKDEELPEALKGKTREEQRKIIDEKRAERKKVQEGILALSKRRADWVAEELKKQAISDENSFDAAMRRSIREQAAAKGYAFEETK